MRHVLDYCRARQDWLLDTTTALARIESPTTDKAAVDACGRELARRLEALGGRVTRLPRDAAGDHLLAEFGCGREQVLILGHFDTVWPVGQLERMPILVDGGRLHGPGVYDMKAGLAIGMLAVQAALELDLARARRVTMLLTSDEETGSHSSRQAIEEEGRRSRAVLVLEPALPNGAVKTFRKGVGEFRLDVEGVAAHAGVDPGKGASAIDELARQIVALGALRDEARGVSVNVGLVEGGTRSNVVAERASAVIDLRLPTRADADRVEAVLRALRPVDVRTRLMLSGAVNRYPFERTEAVARLFALARSLAAEMGLDLAEAGTGGASDGNFTAALGVPTLDGLGAVGDGAHALHEHVVLDLLPQRAALVAGLLGRIEG